MANVIIKSDERREQENRVLRDFANRRPNEQPTREQREAAEIIARRTAEAVQRNNK